MERHALRTFSGPDSRAHIVLVPGFAGFDALGQINYYAGTSCVFRHWLLAADADELRRRTVLHYFDNLPSGAVATRAARLHAYLAKRIARNEFQPGDCIVLVGHSTGGLDIRHLLMDLKKPGELRVDGSRKDFITISNQQVLDMIRRVVFLSTPHYGSNIADAWIGRTRPVRFAVRLALLGLYASRLVPSRNLNRLLGKRPELDAWYAIQDTLLEAHDRGIDDPTKAADARESFSQISLWLRQMAADFSVLADLETNRNARKAEEAWPSSVISKSYATVSPTPRIAKLTLTSLLRGLFPNSSAPELNAQDLLYRAAHAMTAKGAFRRRAPIREDWFEKPPLEQVPILDDAANDGIVNTASMFWQHGGSTRLVLADHGDIIGHYRRSPEAHPAEPGSGRRFESYDFFKSGSGFKEQAFQAVWHDVFTFCSHALEVRAEKPDRDSVLSPRA